MTLRLNLAALTEGELLALLGPAETQRRLPEITRARLEGQALPGGEVPVALPADPLPEDAGRMWGATPEQSRALAARHTELLAQEASLHGTYEVAAGHYLRAYTLGEVALGLEWHESGGHVAEPSVWLLSWLRDRASGLAYVLTSNAPRAPVPTGSEEADLHLHPTATLPELLALHRQQVQRLGRPRKLAPEQGWYAAWQAAYDLNLLAWKRRGVVLEGASEGAKS